MRASYYQDRLCIHFRVQYLYEQFDLQSAGGYVRN
jgi:hypothetical protein